MTARSLVERCSRWHRKNRWAVNRDYPQLWYCMPSKKRHPRLRRLLQWLCGVIVGHEISKTETGMMLGAQFVDCNCRWCDKLIQVPAAEFPFDLSHDPDEP